MKADTNGTTSHVHLEIDKLDSFLQVDGKGRTILLILVSWLAYLMLVCPSPPDDYFLFREGRGSFTSKEVSEDREKCKPRYCIGGSTSSSVGSCSCSGQSGANVI
jgi:hypothetical protein